MCESSSRLAPDPAQTWSRRHTRSRMGAACPRSVGQNHRTEDWRTLHRSSSRGRTASRPRPGRGLMFRGITGYKAVQTADWITTHACRITRRRDAGDAAPSRWTANFEQMRPKPSGGPVVKAFAASLWLDRSLKRRADIRHSKLCVLSKCFCDSLPVQLIPRSNKCCTNEDTARQFLEC